MLKKMLKCSMKMLKSSRPEIKLFWKFTKKQPRNFHEQPFKKLLWNSFTNNSSRTLDYLHTLDNFSFILDNCNNKF